MRFLTLSVHSFDVLASRCGKPFNSRHYLTPVTLKLGEPDTTSFNFSGNESIVTLVGSVVIEPFSKYGLSRVVGVLQIN